MSNKTAKKTPVAKTTAVAEVVKPTLAEIVSGKGSAVEKAVAEKSAALLALAPASDGKGPKVKLVLPKPDVAPAKAVKANKKAEKAAKKGTAKKEEKTETVASFMRRLIGEGKSNEDVFAAAQKAYGIGEEKKHYPSWYRCEMKRKAAAEKAPAAKTEKAPAKKELPKVTKVATKKVSAKA